MTYCGAIGSVNVLEFMSTELFDESQENPFLLKTPPSPLRDGSSASPSKSCSSPQQRLSLAKSAFELPLHDPQQDASSYHRVDASAPPSSPTKMYQQQQQQPQQHAYYQSAPTSPVQQAPSPSGRASVTFNLPKSILKRQSSYDSDSSTLPPSEVETDAMELDVNETELHKLLYSLARFSVASETSVVSDSRVSLSPQRQHSISQPVSPSAAGLSATSLWFDEGSAAQPRSPYYPSPMSSPSRAVSHQGQRPGPQQRNPSTKKKARSKSADRGGYETDPDTQDEYESEDDGRGRGRAARSRGSVSFETVKNLLRGGGSGSRASRIVKRAIPELRRKSMGTVSSRLKRRQKFERPTILTDAYHRVSTMKLGTKPMPVKVKYMAFPELTDADRATLAELDADSGIPSPRGQLRHNSLVLLETLDKIGTRAACPVHLIEEEAPDYSNVPARVDSHNHMVRPKQGLRRPSAWLMGNAAAMASFQAPPQCYDSD